MAKKKKKKIPSKLTADERVPKLVGLFCIFMAIYLSIAFVSYLFTWKQDQDISGWANLFSNELVENWLGRLGAVISHQFFYYGFGFSSFILVFLLFLTGFNLIIQNPISKLIPVYKKATILMFFSSFILAFILQNFFEFPWGGTFGIVMVSICNGLVGSIGIIALIIFILLAYIVWYKNPNFNDGISMEELKDSFTSSNVFAALKNIVDLIPKKEKDLEKELELATGGNSLETLRPGNYGQKNSSGSNTDLVLKNDENQEMDDVSVILDHQPETESSKPKLELILGKNNNEEDTQSSDLDIVINQEGEKIDISITQENEDHFEPYDPTKSLSRYENPIVDLLDKYEDQKPGMDRAELDNNKDQIIETLLNYKIEITNIKATIGPTVTLYEIVPAPGVRISRIKSLEDDIALSLAALGIRIIAPIPGKGTIGIEVPNRNKRVVSLREVLASTKYQEAKMDLPVALGKTISDEIFVADLAKMPHLLIAGATGQGKSVGINTVIMSLLYKKHPSQLKLILIDPKKVELSLYNRISAHYLGYLPDEEEAIVTDVSKVVQTLYSLTVEMDERYNLLKSAEVRNINEYNKKFISRRLNPNNGHKFMPFIVLIIDEFADLIMTAGKEVELPIGRLAQLARAVGIHLIIATQRPSVNIITGLIKANFPARLAFKVTSKIDSRTILDGGGAEQLIGRGDMLLSSGGKLVRIQCAFVDTHEVDRVIEHIANQPGYPEPFLLPAYGEDIGGDSSENQINRVLQELDDHFDDAARLVVINQQGSTSMIQRRLKLGYNRAGRIMDQLESTGIVGPNEGSKARQVLVSDEIELEHVLKELHEKRKKMSFK